MNKFLRMNIPVVLLLSLFAGNTLLAQLSLTIDSINATNFPVIRSNIRVMENNAFVTGLNVSNFTVLEDGIVQAPIQVMCNDTMKASPVSVLLVIDRSGSMSGTPLFTAKTAAKNFVDRLSLQDEAALLSFGGSASGVSYDQSWTNNKNLLKSAIDGLFSIGGTPLWRAVRQGSQLTRPRVKKKVMIVLTDGEDTDGGVSLQEAIQQARNDSVIVFTIGLGNGINVSELQSLAQQTGGKYYSAPSPSDLDAIYQMIVRQLTTSGACEIWYTSKINCLNGSTHELEIVVTSGGKTDRKKGSFTIPLDSTSFTFVDMAVKRQYVVEQDSLITIPISLTRLTPNRPPKVFQFSITYDKTILEYVSADTTKLSNGYVIQLSHTINGTDFTLQGANAITTTGDLLYVTFKALPSWESKKVEIQIGRPDVQQFCTVTSSANGLITVSGRCERAMSSQSKVQKNTSRIISSSPNPFNPATVIRYHVGKEGKVTLKLFDALGRELQTLVNEEKKASDYSYSFDGSGFVSGKYFVRLITPDGRDERQIVLVK